MPDTGHRSNRNFIIVSAIFAVFFLVYGITNFNKAFPEHAINMEISRTDALDSARVFLESRNFDLAGFKQSIVFDSNNQSRTYLERELGNERTASLARDSIDVWYWRVRFFRPLEKLEYLVKIKPTGEVISFERTVPDATEGPLLDQSVAQILAEAFLVSRMNISLEDWQFIEAGTDNKPQRTDHRFTYELKDFLAGDAPYRLYIVVQGAEIGGFQKNLQVPEEWSRTWERQRSQNNLFQNITMFIAFLMVIAVFIYFFRHVKQKQVPWKTALGFGIALAAVNLVTGVNSIPLSFAYYDTTSSFSAFISIQMLGSIVNGLLEGMLVLLLIGAGEMLYRRDYPEKLALHNILSRRGIQSREFIQATLMGYILVAIDIGFVVFYYIMGEKIGFWSPAEIKYNNTVSTLLPWIAPIAVSMSAALLEEFWFRFFGISLFKRLTKSTVLAVIIPALIWGFLHSSYPQQPGFARGIEVGLMGILAGVVMLRFGIWATLVWHFVLDAVWVGLFLFQSDNTYFWVSGVIVCSALAIPAIVAGILYIRKRGVESTDDLLNRSVKYLPESSQLQNTISPVEPLSTRKNENPSQSDTDISLDEVVPISDKAWSIGRVCGFLGLIGAILILFTSAPRLGDDYSPVLTRREAIKSARQGIEKRYGINPDDFKISIIDDQYLNESDYYKKGFYSEFSYIHKHADLETAKQIYFGENGTSYASWIISFVQEFNPESYRARIEQVSGKMSLWHIWADTTSGAELSQDSALVLAETAFQETIPDFQDFKLVKKDTNQQLNREDHFFWWESIEPAVAEAHYRIGVAVKGDEVTANDSRSLKIPEDWQRHEDEKTIRWVVIQIFGFILIIAALFWSLISLGKRVIKHDIRWKSGLIAGGLTFLLTAANVLNKSATVWWEYNSSEPAANFLTSAYLNMLMEIIFTSLSVIVLVSLAEGLISSVYGAATWLNRRNNLRNRKDSSLTGLLGSFIGISLLLSSLTFWFKLPVHNFNLSLPTTLTTFLPWYSEFFDAFRSAIISGSFLMILFIMINHGLKWEWLRWGVLALISIVIAGFREMSVGNPTNAELAWHAVQLFVYAAILMVGLRYWIPGRLWALMLVIYTALMLRSTSMFYSWEGSPYQIWSVVLLGLAILPLVAVLEWTRRGRRETQHRQDAESV